MGGAALISRGLSRGLSKLGEHCAGFFGASEDYERAYVPWDELMAGMIEANPEQYGESELVLEHSGVDEEEDE